MIGTIEDLAQRIDLLPLGKPCQIIALSGFGGAGKSTSARILKTMLSDCEVVSVDEFIVNQLRGDLHCWNGVDWARLEREVLRPASEGASVIEYGVYDWSTDCVTKTRQIELPRLLIIEGVGLLRPELTPYFDLKVLLDVPLEIAMNRGMQRDREQYGVDFEHEWRDVWSINDREYFEKYKPMESADFVLSI